MVQTWPDDPQFKLVAGGEDFINDKALQIRLVRPENSVSNILLTINDYKSSAFEDVFDVFAAIELHLRYGSDAWNKAFSGIIKNVAPGLSLEQGETLVVTGEGEGRAVVNTHCNTSFGVESQNTAKNAPKQVWDDLVDNFINKAFGGGATGYAITKTKIANIASPSITHILSPYDPCFNIINRVCEIYNAHRAGSASVHWFVDPDKNLFINTIGVHENNATGWPTFWKTTEALSTLAVKEDQLLYQFQKRINHFANKILLASAFRKPGYDWLCEDGGPVWGAVDATATYDNTQKVVGSHSLLLEPTNSPSMGTIFYPGKTLLTGDAAAGQPDVTVASVAELKIGDEVTIWDNTPTTETAVILSIAGLVLTMTANLTNAYQVADAAYVRRNAKWDFTKCGSENHVPTFNFYVRANSVVAFGHRVLLCTDRIPLVGGASTDYFETILQDYMEPIANKWIHISLPIGPYYALHPALQKGDETDQFEWKITNNADWAEINFICLDLTGDNAYDKWFDDMHFAGKIIREAYNSTSIAAKKEFQRIIRNDVALDDTLKASDDSGTAARLAYAELLRRQTIPTVATIQIPMAPTMLPGQLIHIHSAQKANLDYRVDENFRVTQLIHNIALKPWSTTINLTNDLLNSFAFGPPTRASVLAEHVGALKHQEAHNLKGSGIDVLIPRLSKDYPS